MPSTSCRTCLMIVFENFEDEILWHKYRRKKIYINKKTRQDKTGLVGQARELGNNVLISLISFLLLEFFFILLQNEYKHALEDVTDV